ncbi:helix-turn-helix domain-containing protein [Streptomyces sp. BA2]|uniref:helix-turn-helix domain-containing protein n=1 Tax=Streptomyces sp. BA2 TaxID=436595 RepID=UPI00132AC215|nr:helix-turn-helix domain-containing protein [Streptomyces sp. BA2]
MGTTPARYLEQVRVRAAQRFLESADIDTEAIARRCGFGSAERMRRSFQRVLGISPSAYRERFRSGCPVDHPALLVGGHPGAAEQPWYVLADDARAP